LIIRSLSSGDVRSGLEEGEVVAMREGGGKGKRVFGRGGRGGRLEGRDEGEGKQRRENRGLLWVNWREVEGKRT